MSYDWKNLGDNALVAVTSSELVAHGDLSLLRHEHTDQLIHAWWQFVAGIAGEHLHVDDASTFTVRHLQ